MMKFTRTLMIAVLPGLLLACAGEPGDEAGLGEIDSPEALAGSADTSGGEEDQPEQASGDDLLEEGASEEEVDAQSDTEGEAEAVVEDACRVADVNLNDFEAWRREAGWWVGEYTLLGADGNPSVSSRWPYRYDHYRGFIHLEVIGNAIKQRNVFLYPPQSEELCGGGEEDVLGSGTCGENGNEKVFSADQNAVDCKGNLA